MSAKKPAPRPFAQTRHIGQDQREEGVSPATSPAAAPAPQLSATGLRRALPLHDLASVTSASAAQPTTLIAPLAGGLIHVDTADQLARVSAGETVLINTQLIAENPTNARVFYKSAEVDETALSIAEDKQDVAASGWIEDGRVYLIDGGKRLRSVRSVSVPYLKVSIEVKPGSGFDAWMKSRRMNDLRSGHTVYDDAVRFSDMLRAGEASSQADLIEKIKAASKREMTQGHVSQIVSIGAIPRALMMRLVEVPALCSKKAAYEISRLYSTQARETFLARGDGEEGALAAAEQVVDQIILAATRDPEMTSMTVRDFVKRALGEITREKRAQTVSTPMVFGGFKGKLTAVPKRGHVRLELNAVPEDRVEEIHALLLKVLGDETAGK